MLCVLEEPYTFTKTGGKFSPMNVQNVQNHIYQPLATLFPISYFMWEWLCLPCLSHNHIIPIQPHLGPLGQLIIAAFVIKAFLGKEPQLWHTAWYGSVIWFTMEEKLLYPEALTQNSLWGAQSSPWGNSSAFPVCRILTRRLPEL